VCHAAQEAGTPHCEYNEKKKENMILTPENSYLNSSKFVADAPPPSHQLGESTYRQLSHRKFSLIRAINIIQLG